MNEIDELQLQRYREMTGEQRLRIGLGLFESSVEISRQAVRDRFPDADPEEVEERVQRRIRAGYEIQQRSEIR